MKNCQTQDTQKRLDRMDEVLSELMRTLDLDYLHPEKENTFLPEAKVNISGLKVNLSLEIGIVQISIGELLELIPGELLELKYPQDSVMRLFLDKLHIADAVFVEREGGLAIKIVQLIEDVSVSSNNNQLTVENTVG